MISNNSEIKNHEEIISNRDVLCTSVVSDSPFISNQDFELPKGDKGISSKDSCTLSIFKPSSNNAAKIFFEENLNNALKRAEKWPNNPDILNNTASKYIKSDQIDKALEILDRCLEIKSNYFPAIANKADCFVKKGNLDTAIKLYLSLENNERYRLAVYSNVALLELKRNSFDESLKFLHKALNLSKRNSSIHSNIGVVNLIKGNIDKAISFLRKATKIKTDDYQAYNNLGVCYITKNDIQKGLIQFKTAYKINSLAKNVIINLSNAYNQLESYEESSIILIDYLSKFPFDLDIRKSLCLSLYKSSQYKRCIQELLKTEDYLIKDSKNEYISLYNNLAVVYGKLGNLTKSKKYFTKILEIDQSPEDIIFFNIISFLYHIRKYDLAKMLLDERIKAHPNNSILYSYYGEYYINENDYDNAKEFFYKALELNPKNNKAALSLSTIETDAFENFDKSLNILKDAIVHNPKDRAIRNNYAYCLIQSGDLKTAREILEDTDLNDNVHLHATMGLLLIKEGCIEEGREFYNKAAKIAHKNSNLFNLVNQKKYLETAVYFINNDDKEEAIKQLNKGLKYKTNESYYKDKIISLIHQYN